MFRLFDPTSMKKFKWILQNERAAYNYVAHRPFIKIYYPLLESIKVMLLIKVLALG